MNKAVRKTVSVLGTIFGVSGMCHGFFEILQGNQPTGGFYISAIGPAQQMWPHGTEPALTLIPNFLFSGIAAMLVGLVMIVWSLFFVHRKHGPAVLLLLFILLLLLGGGVAQIIFFPFIWLVATRINASLAWWDKSLPTGLKKFLVGLWPADLVLVSLLLVSALVMAVTGCFPLVSDPNTIVMIMVGFLGLVLLFLPVVYISAFSRDLVQREGKI